MTNARKIWMDAMIKIIDPVLDALSRDCLRREMPIESISLREDREQYTYLEAFGRIVLGIAPWLGCQQLVGEEENMRKKYVEKVRRCLEICVDPKANDKMNFSAGYQPIVDAAFLACGILRAPEILWDPLEKETKERLVQAMRDTRTRRPYRNNWLLFGAMIERLLYYAGAPDWDPMRVDYALMKHMEWYMGDGYYGDGKNFHWDYYNSFVIQPLLLEIISHMKGKYTEWDEIETEVWKRAAHCAVHQEHLISPEGTYPLIGRSLTYRFGAFHLLSTVSYSHRLPDIIKPSQVRCALTAVIQRTIAFDTMFDERGWLQIGICGHQPDMGEPYISTGSLYLCCAVFPALGLPETDEFWSMPDQEWTMKVLWSGKNNKCSNPLD